MKGQTAEVPVLEVAQVISRSRNGRRAQVTFRFKGNSQTVTAHLVRKGDRWYTNGYPEKNDQITKHYERMKQSIPSLIKQEMEGFVLP